MASESPDSDTLHPGYVYLNEIVNSFLPPRQSPYPSLMPQQQHIGRTQREQAVGDDAGDVVELGFEFGGFHDAEVVHVDNQVAVIGGVAIA